MSRFLLVSLSLAAMTSLVVVPVVHAEVDMVTQVAKFNGTITDVGVVRGPGQTGGVEYRIRGELISAVNIDLSDATFTIDEFFVELEGAAGAGAGELMRKSQGNSGPENDPPLAPCGPGILNCPLTQSQGDADDAKFDTPGKFRPQIRVKVEKDEDDDGFKYKFDVRLDRGMMRERPKFCPGDHAHPGLTPDEDGRFRTSIEISFTIADPANEITVTTTKRWECPQPGRYHLRSR